MQKHVSAYLQAAQEQDLPLSQLRQRLPLQARQPRRCQPAGFLSLPGESAQGSAQLTYTLHRHMPSQGHFQHQTPVAMPWTAMHIAVRRKIRQS